MGDEPRRHDPFTNVKYTGLSGVSYPVQPSGRWSREFGGPFKRLPARPFMATPTAILRVACQWPYWGNSWGMVLLFGVTWPASEPLAKKNELSIIP